MVTGVTSGDIYRPRLTRAIRDTSPGGLCLVVAPRGYGATTAVRHALQPDEAVWVEPAPDEPLATAVRAALNLSRLDVDSLGTALADRKAQWLVVDGLTQEPPVTVMKTLGDSLGAEVRLVVTGRVALDGVVRGQLATTLITREELAFSALEARTYLERVGEAYGPEQLEAAVEWCEGWPLALKVASARLRHQASREPDAWIVGEGADAIVSPWLDNLTDRQRDFLLSTALLDELEVGSCNAVRGSHDAAEVLASITRRPGLVWRMPANTDGVVVWHRHRLLTEVLRARAAGAADRREAHARAASWFEQQGRVELAVTHLLEAGRGGEAGVLLREHETDLLLGDARRTLGWYRRLTPRGWAESAEHWFRLAWGHLLSGNPQGARESLVHLAALAQAVPAEEPPDYTRGWFEGNLAVLEAEFAAYCGDAATMAAKAARARVLFDPGTSSNAQQLAPLAQALGLLWQDDITAARETLAGIDTTTYPNAVLREVVFPGIDALCAWREGRVRQARHLVSRAEAWLNDTGPDLDARSLGPLGMARALVTAESGDLEEAQAIAGSVEQGARARGHVGETTVAVLVSARILLWQGDARSAHSALVAGREELLLSCPTSAMTALIDQLEAQVLLRLGEGARAERLIRRLPNSPTRELLAMRLLSASGAAPATRALTTMRPSTPRLAALRRLQLAEFFLGRDEALTRSHLYAAAGIAQEHGMTLLLRDYPALRRPAADAAEKTSHEGLARMLQAEKQGIVPRAPLLKEVVPAPRGPTVNLSPGERELLELLPSRRSNAQIAEHLGVSLNTVKTRLQRLYRKLGVSTRDDALVAVAKGRAG